MPRNRDGLVLAVVAGLVLTGCAGSPTAPATTSPEPSRSASAGAATPTAPAPRVALDGDCSAALSPGAAAAVFEGATPSLHVGGPLGIVTPDLGASAALLGGLPCVWIAEGSRIGALTIDIFPASQIPPDIAADEDFTCGGWGECGRAETHDGVWARAVVGRWTGNDLTADEKAVLSAAVDAALAGVFAKPRADLLGVPVEAGPTWWAPGDCADLEEAVVTATGMVDPQQGFPGDSVPDGATWEILVAAGLAQWCPWYSYTADAGTIVELVLQPGLGDPTAQQLEAANAQQIELAGADSAFLLVLEDRPSARSTKVVAVSEGNRLTVAGDDPETIAAEVLAELQD